MANCILPTLEEHTDNLYDDLKEKTKDFSTAQLKATIYDMILQGKDDINNPKLASDIRDALTAFSAQVAKLDIKTENDKIFSNKHIEKSIREFENSYREFLIENHQDGGTFPGILGATLKFLNKNFKSLTIGSAVGRVLNEGVQSSTVVLTQKLSNLSSALSSDKFLLSSLGFDKTYTQPNFGTINKRLGFGENSKTGMLAPDDVPLYRMLSKPGEMLMKMQSKIADPVTIKLENSMYQSLAPQKYLELVIKESTLGATKNSPLDKSNDFYYKENITPQNLAKKMNMVEKAKRLAREEASKLFFDYQHNPLIINKMEQVIPFTNFLYSGVRLLSTYPKTFMLAATALNNLQYAYGDSIWYLDDKGAKIDAGIAMRLPILASLGLGSVSINLQRMLQFSPTSTTLNPLPIFSFITNRDDWRWQKFYTEGDMKSLQNVGLSMVGPTISQLFEGIRDFDKPIDPRDKVNATAKITQALAYMTTGVVIKDKTQMQAWKWYIDNDFDNLLSLSSLQLNEFFKSPANAGKGLDINSIKAAKKAQELGLLNKDFETDPQTALLRALSGLGLHDKVVTSKELNDDAKQIANLVELTLGSLDKSGEFDKGFYDKCVQLSKSTNFKSFEAYNPTLYKVYKHFAENAPWYKEKDRSYELMYSKDTNEKKQGIALNLALKYRFKGDEGMSPTDKAFAIISGKLTQPIQTDGYSKDGLPPGPLMTEGYYNSLDFKGQAVQNYMFQANKTLALENLRSTFSRLGGLSKADDPALAKKYFNLANTVYEEEKQARRMFELTKTNEFDLYLLSKENIKFSEVDKKEEAYLNSKLEKNTQRVTSKWDKMQTLTEDEKKFYNSVLGTNIDAKSKAELTDMLSDLGNPYYNQQIVHKNNFQNILNTVNYGK